MAGHGRLVPGAQGSAASLNQQRASALYPLQPRLCAALCAVHAHEAEAGPACDPSPDATPHAPHCRIGPQFSPTPMIPSPWHL